MKPAMLLMRIEAHVRTTFGVDEFVLLDRYHKKNWFLGHRRVFVVGVRGRRLAIFVGEYDDGILGHEFLPDPEPGVISGLQALEFAMCEARRLNCPIMGASRVTKIKGAWIVQTGADIIGVFPGFQICDRTGAVQGAWSIPKPGQIRR